MKQTTQLELSKTKEFRKKIRLCKTERELQNLINNHDVWVKRRGLYEKISCYRSVFLCKETGRIIVLLPPAWSCSFKNIAIFSYNVKLGDEE